MDEPADVPVLVTGATGFTGGHLALTLKRRGHPVRALVRAGAEAGHLKDAGIELVEGDIRAAKDVHEAARGARLIYNIAALFRTQGHPDTLFREVNTGGVRNVLAAAAAHGVERTVHCSTIGVHGDVQEVPAHEDSAFAPGDIYQETKLEGELLAQKAFANGLPGAIVRPAAIYGPGDLRLLKLFRTIHSGGFRMFGSGETLFHLVYIDDLVQGFILAAEHPAARGRTYIIAGESWVSLNELTRGIAEAVGVSPPRGHLPFWPLELGAAMCESLCRPFGIEPPLHRRRVAFFIKNRAFSIERARAEIGYRPAVAIQDGLKRTAEWYFEQGHLRRQAA